MLEDFKGAVAAVQEKALLDAFLAMLVNIGGGIV